MELPRDEGLSVRTVPGSCRAREFTPGLTRTPPGIVADNVAWVLPASALAGYGSEMLPNFICVGAQKAGTTTLGHLLRSHPDVFISSPTETRFFFDEQRYCRGLATYEISHFNGWSGQRAVGEKTPEYLLHPEVPRRIHSDLGADTRIVISLRSPAQRAFSHFRHNFSNFTEVLSFDQALNFEPRRVAGSMTRLALFGYLARGRYAEQVERYLQTFSRDQVLILLFAEDILGSQDALCEKIYGFVGVDPGHRPSEELHGKSPQHMIYRLLGRGEEVEIKLGERLQGPLLLAGSAEGAIPIRSPSPTLLRHARVAQANTPGKGQKLSRELELRLNRQYFADDIRRLEGLIERDLGMWLA
jgi:hypothetical protein